MGWLSNLMGSAAHDVQEHRTQEAREARTSAFREALNHQRAAANSAIKATMVIERSPVAAEMVSVIEELSASLHQK